MKVTLGQCLVAVGKIKKAHPWPNNTEELENNVTRRMGVAEIKLSGRGANCTALTGAVGVASAESSAG